MNQLAVMDDELKRLWEAYRVDRCDRIRNKLVEMYLPLLEFHAKTIYSKVKDHVDYDDIYQMAVPGLIQAIERFDQSLGLSFKTYSARRIQGAILDEIRKLDWTPRVVRIMKKRIDAIQAELEESGKEATPHRISKKLGVKPTKFRGIAKEVEHKAVFSYSCPASDAVEVEHVQAMEDKREGEPSTVVIDADLKERLSKILPKLTPRQAEIVKNIFFECQPERKVAKKMNLSKSTIHVFKVRIMRYFRSGKYKL